MEPYVAVNFHRNVVLVYAIGSTVTHYLGVDGCQLNTLRQYTKDFDRQYRKHAGLTPAHFARLYLSSPTTRRMIPVSGSAFRVLRAIIGGAFDEGHANADLQELYRMTEETTATEATDTANAPKTFRKPEGAVARVHNYLTSRIEEIRAGTVTRKELIAVMQAQGLNVATIVTQLGVWTRQNGLHFQRAAPAPKAQTEAVATPDSEQAAPKKRGRKKAEKTIPEPTAAAPDGADEAAVTVEETAAA